VRRRWTHYAAPAAFLLAVTIAVLLVRSAINSDSATETTVPAVPTTATTRTTTRPAATTRRTITPATRFYTVVAGDTFGVISSKTGVSVVRLEELNPNVESTALYIGQKIRIR
jgi:LysM repeat protein